MRRRRGCTSSPATTARRSRRSRPATTCRAAATPRRSARSAPTRRRSTSRRSARSRSPTASSGTRARSASCPISSWGRTPRASRRGCSRRSTGSPAWTSTRCCWPTATPSWATGPRRCAASSTAAADPHGGGPGPSTPLARFLPVTTALADLPLVASGKVREIYDLGDRLLMVASDRISTYDVVHPTPIPDKGKVLAGLSVFWFAKTGHIIPNHFVSATEGVPDEVRGRALVVRKLDMVPLEAVVRGYITGSGWKDYGATGGVSGIALPPGLRESEQLPTPIFTPSTKAEEGHDETVDLDRAVEIVGDRELVQKVRDASIALYSFAAEHARERGVILADTKFEFGFDREGVLRVGDEVLTPDSSRFWPADGYEPGRGQPSYDKQYVRDWASGTGWDKQPPAPPVPDDVVARTRELYIEAYERITGEPFQAWLDRTGG